MGLGGGLVLVDNDEEKEEEEEEEKEKEEEEEEEEEAVEYVRTLGCGSLVEGDGSTRCQVVVVEGGDGGKRRLKRSLGVCILDVDDAEFWCVMCMRVERFLGF